MRTILNILVGFGTALSLLALLSCTKEDPTSYRPIQEEKQEQENGETTMPEKITITISGVTLQIVLENNVVLIGNDYGKITVGNLLVVLIFSL